MATNFPAEVSPAQEFRSIQAESGWLGRTASRYTPHLTPFKGHPMRLLPDVDAVILMATALSAKRRPAALPEIVAAADLLQGFVPYPDKLGDAMKRLSSAGLIGAVEDGFALTPAAERLVAALPKKAETEERIAALRSSLAAYAPKEEHAPVAMSAEQLAAAIAAHEAAKRSSGQNMAMPKPKPDRHFKVEGRWRRASGTRDRKS
jgi:hypothetical protein